MSRDQAPAETRIDPRTAIDALLDRLENYYDFECTGGPLRQCRDWSDLKDAIHLLFQGARPPLTTELLQQVRELESWQVDDPLSPFVGETVVSREAVEAIVVAIEDLPEDPPGSPKGWQPIETAPKNETVLVIDRRTVEPRVICAERNMYGQWLTVPGRYTFNPIAWMPAPAATLCGFPDPPVDQGTPEPKRG